MIKGGCIIESLLYVEEELDVLLPPDSVFIAVAKVIGDRSNLENTISTAADPVCNGGTRTCPAVCGEVGHCVL
jgi:hypothetical protein